MKNFSNHIFILMSIYLLFVSCEKTDNRLIALTEEFPPLNYTYNDSAYGCSSEIVRKLFKESNIEGEISIMNWTDAYNEAQKRPNTLIFSIARTSDREKLFNWIGQITIAESNVFALKGTVGLSIKSYKDLSRYKTSVIRDSYISDFLKDNGIIINETQYASSPVELVNKLMAKDVELIIVNKLVLNYIVRNLGYYLSDFKEILKVPELDKKYYVAISKNSDPDLVKKLQLAYKSLEEESFIVNTVDKYISTY